MASFTLVSRCIIFFLRLLLKLCIYNIIILTALLHLLAELVELAHTIL